MMNGVSALWYKNSLHTAEDNLTTSVCVCVSVGASSRSVYQWKVRLMLFWCIDAALTFNMCGNIASGWNLRQRLSNTSVSQLWIELRDLYINCYEKGLILLSYLFFFYMKAFILNENLTWRQIIWKLIILENNSRNVNGFNGLWTSFFFFLHTWHVFLVVQRYICVL